MDLAPTLDLLEEVSKRRSRERWVRGGAGGDWGVGGQGRGECCYYHDALYKGIHAGPVIHSFVPSGLFV